MTDAWAHAAEYRLTLRVPVSEEFPEPRGGKSRYSQTDHITQDLIDSMTRLSRDELHRRKVANKLF